MIGSWLKMGAFLGAALASTLAPKLALADAECISFSPQAQWDSAHFKIHYDLTGENASVASDVGKQILRSDGYIIGYAQASNGIPDYVEEVAVSLEYAYETYRLAGFRLPASQDVYIKANLGAYGIYAPTCAEIYLEPDLIGVTRTATHELFHAVQYQYWTLEDFEAIPAIQQAFYKEATADAAMIQVMRPRPYVALFEDPDSASLYNSGTGAAHFWVYYGEQFGSALPEWDLMPGLPGLARYFETVASAEFDLYEALQAQCDGAGLSLDSLLENFLLTNGLYGALQGVDPLEQPVLNGLSYVFGYLRGFYNGVVPVDLDPSDSAEPDNNRSLEITGKVSNYLGADYFEIPLAWFETGTSVEGRFEAASHGGARGWLVTLLMGEDRVQQLSVVPLGSEAFHLNRDPQARFFLAIANLDDQPLDYTVVVEDEDYFFDGDFDGYSVSAGDCDDGAPSVYPGAAEVQDALDNDCDGVVDESPEVIATPSGEPSQSPTPRPELSPAPSPTPPLPGSLTPYQEQTPIVIPGTTPNGSPEATSSSGYGDEPEPIACAALPMRSSRSWYYGLLFLVSVLMRRRS